MGLDEVLKGGLRSSFFYSPHFLKHKNLHENFFISTLLLYFEALKVKRYEKTLQNFN